MQFRKLENASTNRNYGGVVINTFVLNDDITYGAPRTFIKNNYLKMHGKPMVRKSTRRKQKYVIGLFRLRH